MANEINTWYENYHAFMGQNAYSMEKAKHTSRILFLQDYIKKHTPKGGKILDVGCGDMYLAKVMPEYEWHGVDLAPNTDHPNAVKQDLMVPPYPYLAQSFDTIVCSEVLEHLWDLRVVHQEVKRLLKPKGIYIVSTPNFDHIDHLLGQFRPILFSDHQTHFFEHIRFYNKEVHTRFLNKAGFKVGEIMGADAHFSQFFQRARGVLLSVLRQKDPKVTEGFVDQILGASFPDISHTIMLIARNS